MEFERTKTITSDNSASSFDFADDMDFELLANEARPGM